MPASLQQLKLLVLQRPGRLSNGLDSETHVASHPAQAQQGWGVSVMAGFALTEVGVKPQAGQGWGRGRRQERIC